jgi:hypothetical protein
MKSIHFNESDKAEFLRFMSQTEYEYWLAELESLPESELELVFREEYYDDELDNNYDPDAAYESHLESAYGQEAHDEMERDDAMGKS